LVAFTGNPIRYEVQTDAYISAVGSFSVFALIIGAPDSTPDHSFTLNFAGKSITFTISSSDDGTGTIIPPAAGGDTAEQFAIKIYNVLMTNYELFMNYSIGRVTNTITLMARMKGVAYKMTLTDNTITSLTGNSTDNGTDQTYYADFGILATIFDNDGIMIGQDFKPVNEDGIARFDISEYLKSKLALDQSLKMTFPEVSDFTHTWSNFIKPYAIAFAEKKADEVFKLYPDDTKYAIGGGLNRETLVYYNKLDIDYFSTIGYGIVSPDGCISNFLTWQPVVKKTGKSVNEKLYFLVPLQGETLKYGQLYVRTSFTDGTDNISAFGDPFELHSFKVIECMTGYAHLGLAAMFSTKTVKAWEIYITMDGILISEVRRYEPDLKFHTNERIFYYKNSFSVFDCIFFTGIRETTNNYERTNGVVMIDENDNEINAPIRQFQNMESQTFQISSGWLKKEWKDTLRDMLLSTEIYEVIGDRLVRILDDTKKVSMFRDKVGNYSLDFEYEYANTDEFYSMVPVITDLQENENITCDSDQFTCDTELVSADMDHY